MCWVALQSRSQKMISVREDFAEWRKEQIEEQIPDPEEEGVGLSMYLVPCPTKSAAPKIPEAWGAGRLGAF